MTRTRRPPRSRRRAPRLLIYCCVGAALVLAAALLFLLRGQPGVGRFDASAPLSEDDLRVNGYRMGIEPKAMRERPASIDKGEGWELWEFEGASLRFSGSPLRLTGAQMETPEWVGPRGTKVGDPLDDLYKVIPVTDYEEQPDDFVLLYAQEVTPDGLPSEPYAVLLPSGIGLCARLVSRLRDGSAFAICNLYADPDTNLIQRITWEIADADFMLESLR